MQKPNRTPLKKTMLKAGIIQIDIKFADLQSNLAAALEGLARTADLGVEIILLPELWSCGFDNRNLSTHAQHTPMIIERLRKKAEAHNIIIAGSLPELCGTEIYNTLYLINRNGDIDAAYRKIHLFTLTGENKYFRAGNKAVVAKTSVGTVGLMTCYDLRFPELCRSLALQGARIVLISAAWPLSRIDHWNILLKARAVENQLFIIAANMCGRDPDIVYGGCSQIVSPQGVVLAKTGSKARLLSAEINMNELEDFRKQIPCLKERAPDAYFR
jgi:predicted amidohydrolase